MTLAASLPEEVHSKVAKVVVVVARSVQLNFPLFFAADNSKSALNPGHEADM